MIDLDALRAGSPRSLAKAITLVESTLAQHREQAQALLEAILPFTGNSLRIGISGVPGVGKSTFIEAFGLYLLAQGKRVAVLAVDPSSPVAGGSILGDKTRMPQLARSNNAFIRPTPTAGALGGVAHKTRETLLLCEAAGFDVIVVETVGVGQSEYDVAGMVDFFTVLMLPNAGDELQGIKRGIVELADALLINKADGHSIDTAQQTRRQYENALQLLRPGEFWSPQVLTCSALIPTGMEAIWAMMLDYQQRAIASENFQIKRANQAQRWLDTLLQALLQQKFSENAAIKSQMPALRQEVREGRTTPAVAAQTLIDMLFMSCPDD